MTEPETPQASLDYARLQEEHGGKYVATRSAEVIASAGNLGELFETLDSRGDYTEDVVVRYVRPKGRICVY